MTRLWLVLFAFGCQGKSEHTVTAQGETRHVITIDADICDGIDNQDERVDCLKTVIEFLKTAADCKQRTDEVVQ